MFSVTLLSEEEIRKLNYLKGIIDEDPTTDFCKIIGGGNDLATRCFDFKRNKLFQIVYNIKSNSFDMERTICSNVSSFINADVKDRGLELDKKIFYQF